MKTPQPNTSPASGKEEKPHHEGTDKPVETSNSKANASGVAGSPNATQASDSPAGHGTAPPEGHTSNGHAADDRTSDLKTNLRSAQTDQRRRELWMYLAVSIIAIEFFIFVGALFFAFAANDNGHIKFPWLSWSAIAIGVPSVLLVSVHLAVGLFTSSASRDEEWQRHLPERLQKVYTIIKRAPAVVLLLGLIALGVALFTLDGAFQALEHFFTLFRPYVLHILIATAVVILILGLGSFWFSYRTRKLYADYEYRRAVLEKTGLIIVGKNNFILSGDSGTLTPIAAENAKALPQGETIDSNAASGENGQPPSASATGNGMEDITDASYTEVSPDDK